MTMFVLLFAAATPASNPPSFPELTRPAELSDPGLETYTLLDFAGDCVERHPQWGLGDDLQRTDRHYWSTVERSEEVWGSDASRHEMSAKTFAFRCRKADAAAMLKQLDQALDAQDAAFARATDGIEHGLWIGSLKLCKSNVAEVRFGTDRRTKQPELFIKLTAQASTSFASLTRNSVNSRLAVRLEGEIISRPTIYEPMEQGVLLITGPEEQTLGRALSAIEESRC